MSTKIDVICRSFPPGSHRDDGPDRSRHWRLCRRCSAAPPRPSVFPSNLLGDSAGRGGELFRRSKSSSYEPGIGSVDIVSLRIESESVPWRQHNSMLSCCTSSHHHARISSPWQKSSRHSTVPASRRTALLFGHICPICSLRAPCPAGAGTVSVLAGLLPRAVRSRGFPTPTPGGQECPLHWPLLRRFSQIAGKMGEVLCGRVPSSTPPQNRRPESCDPRTPRFLVAIRRAGDRGGAPGHWNGLVGRGQSRRAQIVNPVMSRSRFDPGLSSRLKSHDPARQLTSAMGE